MNAVVRFSMVGVVALLVLAGCGRSYFQGSRAPWRHEAEVRCLSSGAVKIGADDERLPPIEGPGVCGMDFPLKVSALGEPTSLSFADNVRPSGSIPESRLPAWPVRQEYYSPKAAPSAPRATVRSSSGPWISPDDAHSGSKPDDIPPDAILPGSRRPMPSRPQAAYKRVDYQPPPRSPMALGPARAPYTPIPQATLKPAAKLACPIVSALDRWVSDGVQPAALQWFHSPVVTIHQIGSYSCRDMVGTRSRHVSEHAFGNALDISGFTLADGRTITVKNGWRGSPEEQGFLHDVQLYACETFSTVLAPGYNIFHYDHIHVDLMRRASGRRPCRPNAIRGEVAAARARVYYARRNRAPTYTGSIARQVGDGPQPPIAVPGADGFVPGDSGDDTEMSNSAPWPSPPM